MSCNGCKVLRRGCGPNCILRPCLDELDSAQAQANATLFVSKFFGRADLMSFISSVPVHRRPALFRSLLYEACGRTVNPVGGAVGLLSTGNWHLCVQAVETVLAGGALQPIAADCLNPPNTREPSGTFQKSAWTQPGQSVVTQSQPSHLWSRPLPTINGGAQQRRIPAETSSSEVYGSSESVWRGVRDAAGKEPKLLNLFFLLVKE
ncbi:unnamed protein product [Cuscuta epithymum]|uniref:LOB domain-containing protein n=1 Tax=Cuscuta epithymum TaxID=186058 RepID=A0AAV0ENA9_9ASTE|nr:unnamed protein product [Cuscuta epithymum]